MRITFSGHESFPCKSLWLKKGFDFVQDDNNFNAPDAVVKLGVGKNMVSSIRYWLRAFGICNLNGEKTEIAEYLFSDIGGKDKYIEDLATLWLLHFLIAYSEEATLYNWLFCGLQRERSIFEKEQVVTYVKLRMIDLGKINQFNENTTKKDVNTLLLNYVLPQKPQSNEDFSSLLIDLDLIRQSSEGKSYYFNVEGKRNVVKEIFMYALLTIKGHDNSISYETIRDSIGLIFCMTDCEIIAMLKQLSADYSDYMTYNDIAGVRQVQFVKQLNRIQVLNDYYENV